MTVHTGADVYNYLKKLLDLPDNATKCTIRLNLDEVATVEVSYYPDINFDKIITKHFKVSEIEDIDSDELPISQHIKISDINDTIELYGIKYSGVLFRGLGFSIKPDETFKIIKRENGTVTIATTRENYAHPGTD